MTNFRVVARYLSPNATQAERDRNFSQLWHAWKKDEQETGILGEIHQREKFETPREKAKRKADRAASAERQRFKRQAKKQYTKDNNG